MDQLFFTFLPKHVTGTHILSHCEFKPNSCDMKETWGQVKINVLYLLGIIEGVFRYTFLGVLQNNLHVHFSVCVRKVRGIDLSLVWWEALGPSWPLMVLLQADSVVSGTLPQSSCKLKESC